MKKLIKEYEGKVKKCDELLNRLDVMIRDTRKNSPDDVEVLSHERAGCYRDRQHYFQFLKDLEDYA